MHWGSAGYGCRIARLTEAESRALYEWSVRASAAQARGRKPDADLPRIADRTPLSGSFVQPENAIRFFAKSGDPALERCARVLFDQIERDAEFN
ncbi:MAG TPA: hypothetical protein VGC30_13395 [Dokdonella sp.]